jgi:hypothetical protein
MKSEEKNNEVDLSEMYITFEVEKEIVEKVRSGEITLASLDVTEENQNLILEGIEGGLVLTTKKLPTKYYGCYFYNRGRFPYLIKKSLNFIIFDSGDDDCLTRIIGVHQEPGTRFNYKGAGEPKEENPKGDSCVWKVTFEIMTLPEETKTYLLRWNPAISSFKEEDFKECVKRENHGMFRLNWSIYEWEEARKGDLFFMMRVGDDKPGIFFAGQFISDPYPADDWAGTTKRRMYVDMICTNYIKPGAAPRVSLEKLEKEIPEINWSKGHSGELLSKAVADKLDALCSEE